MTRKNSRRNECRYCACRVLVGVLVLSLVAEVCHDKTMLALRLFNKVTLLIEDVRHILS